MAEINWGALQQPDYFGNALRGQQLGEEVRYKREQRNALTQKAEREQAAYAARQNVGRMAASGDSAGARKAAAQAGEFDLIKTLNELDDSQRKRAAESAAVSASFFHGLKSVPYEERKARIAANRGQLAARGVEAAMLDNIDPTDAVLNDGIGTAMTIKEHLDEAARAADDKRADQTLDETKRYHGVQEEISRGGLAVSRGNLGVAQSGLALRQQEHAARLANGGYGGVKLKNVPPVIGKAYTENNSSVGQIDEAIAHLKKNPKAMGMANVLGDEIRQRVDSNGIPVRAAVANIGSLVIHDRSGAAVTMAETPRLKPFIPMPTDTAEAAIKKLEGLKRQYQNANAQIEASYGEDSGYSPIRGGGQPAPATPAATKRPPLTSFQR